MESIAVRGPGRSLDLDVFLRFPVLAYAGGSGFIFICRILSTFPLPHGLPC